MAKTHYHKIPLSYESQLLQLENRGLKISDRDKTLHLLENISYYRLSGYWYPLLADKQNHIFKQTAEFDTAFRLYCFDRKLRQLVLGELEKIEVAVRAKMTYILSHKHGAFWFQNQNLFKSSVTHANSLTKINEEFSRSDEDFIASFKQKYTDPLPPSWIILEITSFGALSKLYKMLKRELRSVK